jgi:transcriptional regulator with XRE-family HTH domain
MADECGISYRLYQKLEACRANPTLDSLDRIARAIKVTVGDLLRLRGVQAPGTSDAFVAEFAARFKDSRLGVGIRTHDGMAIWANRRAGELHGKAYEKGPVDLMSMLPPAARDTLRFQLECERRDVIQPYINVAYQTNGEATYLRYYPTNIYPPRGMPPYFSAVYIADLREDTQKNYYEFCEQLLRCV